MPKTMGRPRTGALVWRAFKLTPEQDAYIQAVRQSSRALTGAEMSFTDVIRTAIEHMMRIDKAEGGHAFVLRGNSTVSEDT